MSVYSESHDIMLRRMPASGWTVVYNWSGDKKYHLSTYFMNESVRTDDRMLDWCNNHGFDDPLTCWIESDKWYRETFEMTERIPPKGGSSTAQVLDLPGIVVHFCKEPFIAVCGCDDLNQRGSQVPSNVTCPKCKELSPDIWLKVTTESVQKSTDDRPRFKQVKVSDRIHYMDKMAQEQADDGYRVVAIAYNDQDSNNIMLLERELGFIGPSKEEFSKFFTNFMREAIPITKHFSERGIDANMLHIFTCAALKHFRGK